MASTLDATPALHMVAFFLQRWSGEPLRQPVGSQHDNRSYKLIRPCGETPNIRIMIGVRVSLSLLVRLLEANVDERLLVQPEQ